MTAFEDFMARFSPPPPPAGPAVVQPEPAVVQPDMAVSAVSSADQEAWLRLVERYQKLRAPEFHGGADPLGIDKWKEDVRNIFSLMGVDRVQMQRLATFSLKGGASKWYRAHFSKEEHLETIWEEFLWRFDLHFISSAARAGKEVEFSIWSRGSYLWRLTRAGLSVCLILLTICFRPRSARRAYLREGSVYRSGGIWYLRGFILLRGCGRNDCPGV
jgi:hypothetical protein